MGFKQSKIFVKIEYKNKLIKQIELYANETLSKARVILNKSIDFPFMYLDDDYNEIAGQDESLTKLGDILDGKKLCIKKKINPRKILGEKIDSNND